IGTSCEGHSAPEVLAQFPKCRVSDPGDVRRRVVQLPANSFDTHATPEHRLDNPSFTVIQNSVQCVTQRLVALLLLLPGFLGFGVRGGFHERLQRRLRDRRVAEDAEHAGVEHLRLRLPHGYGISPSNFVHSIGSSVRRIAQYGTLSEVNLSPRPFTQISSYSSGIRIEPYWLRFRPPSQTHRSVRHSCSHRSSAWSFSAWSFSRPSFPQAATSTRRCGCR